jgi:hypothetical protein
VTFCGSREKEVCSAWRFVAARATGVFLNVSIAISRKFVMKLLMEGESALGSTMWAHSLGNGSFARLLYILCIGDVSSVFGSVSFLRLYSVWCVDDVVVMGFGRGGRFVV